MARRLAILLAVVVGGLTAVPGTASASWGPGIVGPANNGWVTDGEAAYITVAWMGNINYCGGALRWNVTRRNPYNNGTGSPFNDVELGVRCRNGALIHSYTQSRYYGAPIGPSGWVFYYTTHLYP